MTNRAKEIVLIVISLLAVAVLGFLVYSRPRPAGPAASGPEQVYAPEGELVPGFPKELLLDGNAKLSNSYRINYPKDNIDQKTATFTSSLTLVQLFNKYKEYFTKNGWAITKEIVPGDKVRGLNAVRDGLTATVVILDKGNLREVQVTNTNIEKVIGANVGATKADRLSPEAQSALKEYFDLSGVHLYDARTTVLDDGRRQYSVSFNTSHIAENRNIIKESLENGLFAVKELPIEGRAFNLIGEKSGETVSAFAVSDSANSGSITIVLVKNQ